MAASASLSSAFSLYNHQSFSFSSPKPTYHLSIQHRTSQRFIIPGRSISGKAFSSIPVLNASRNFGNSRIVNGGYWNEKRSFIKPSVSAQQENHPSQVNPLLDSVKWDEKGLAVAIAQNVDTGAVLMQGFVNKDALSKTISSRKATFYSRSRSSLWTKGETSMNFINVCDIFLDCDRDSIIYLGKPDGPTCHTGAETCYYTSVDEAVNDPKVDGNKVALTTLYSLEATISKRKEELSENADGKPSWTQRLLLDEKLLCSKIREEADELCRTLEENEDKSRTASEMADVLYHAMVLLSRKGVKMEDVFQVLRLRFAESGIQEKSRRNKSQ